MIETVELVHSWVKPVPQEVLMLVWVMQLVDVDAGCQWMSVAVSGCQWMSVDVSGQVGVALHQFIYLRLRSLCDVSCVSYWDL